MGGPSQLSDSAVVTVLQGSPPHFSLQRQAEGQCGDVWWGGPPLLQGRAQLDTSVPTSPLADKHEPVSLSL